MGRRLTCAVGTLVLGWLAGPALAADPVGDPAATVAAQPLLVPNFDAPAPWAPASCGDAPGCGRFIGGAGAYILKPFIELDRAYGRKFPYTGPTLPGGEDPGNFRSQSAVEFSHDFEGAPRVWLGWVSDAGWGARARYFHYEETGQAPPGTLTGADNNKGFSLRPATPLGQTAMNAETNLLAQGFGTDVLPVCDRLALDVWDVEATDEIRAGSWLLTVAGGVRHADIQAYYDVTRFNTLDPVGSERVLHSSHRFTGAGPSFAVDARRLLGATGLAVYGNVRGAFLFGTRRQLAFANSNEIPTGNGSTDLGTSYLQKSDFVPVAEGELGVEWSTDLGGFRPLIQVGVVEQTWFNAMNNNEPGSEPGNSHSSPVTDNGLLSLFGFTITAGVSY